MVGGEVQCGGVYLGGGVMGALEVGGAAACIGGGGAAVLPEAEGIREGAKESDEE